MSNPIFALKWEPENLEAEGIIQGLSKHLDTRKKHLKDHDRNRRILSAVLAYRGGPFSVRYSSLPEVDREAVRSALQCLCGPVLRTLGGVTTYEVKAEAVTGAVKVKTVTQTTAAISTAWGAVYQDGTHDELEFSQLLLLGFAKPNLVEIEGLNRSLGIFVDGQPAPSRNWLELEETSDKHPEAETFMDSVVEHARRYGVVMVRYRENGFLCAAPDSAIFHLDMTLLRKLNLTGRRFLVTVTDPFGRKHPRWGSCS